MPQIFTLFEHETTVGFNWTEKEFSAIERLNKSAGAQMLRPTICTGGVRELQASQHIGVVHLGTRTIQILPKIYRTNTTNKDRAKEATHNLLHLLAYAGQLPVREHEIAPLLKHGDDWFEILTRLFATHLLEEWQRGAYRNYQTVEAESPMLKGKWRITEQIRHPARKHIFSVAYDEFTADNLLNRVFRFVVERLWRLTRNSNNKQMLGDLRQWMEEVTLLSHINIVEANTSLLTRLNQRFAPLLSLALLFLEGGALQLKVGDMNTFSFTFDMNKLFEAFIVNFTNRHRAEILPLSLQDCELLPQSNRARLFLARAESRPVFLLKPDLVFRQQKKFPLLLDAKYKHLNKSQIKLGVSEADFYQMHAYARRYNCERVILIYPQTAEMQKPLRAEFNVEGTQIFIVAATVNIQVALYTKTGRTQIINELKELFRKGE